MFTAGKYSIGLMLAVVLCVAYVQAGYVGGLEGEKPADENVRKVISNVHTDISSRFPKEIETIEPISYRTQVVAGTNYFIKAMITGKDGSKSMAHLRIWRKFTGAHELTALKLDVDEKTALTYFQ